MYRRLVTMWGFPTILCYGKCNECPIRFRCYTTELLEHLEVSPEERWVIRSPTVPEGVPQCQAQKCGALLKG